MGRTEHFHDPLAPRPNRIVPAAEPPFPATRPADEAQEDADDLLVRLGYVLQAKEVRGHKTTVGVVPRLRLIDP